MDRRVFLGALVASGAVASGAAWSAPIIDATATRIGPDRIRLHWLGARAGVRVLASTDPDAPEALMRALAGSARGGDMIVPVGVSPRPYFLIAGDDAQTRVAERLLPLQGGRNFRDLGGYRGAEGRQVKWGRIYRSGVMHGLTLADMEYLSSLGVRTICDLRTTQELTDEPAPFPAGDGPVISTFAYDLGPSLAGLFRARTREEAVQAFSASYLDMANRLAPNYTDMFARLLRREAPLAVNCSAGKDRTGLAAAFILSVLGVSRETIIADYALSQTYVTPDTYRAQMRQASEGAGAAPSREALAFAQLPMDVSNVVLGSDPDVMRITLARLDSDHGGPLVFAKKRFALDDAAVARMRALYLTR